MQDLLREMADSDKNFSASQKKLVDLFIEEPFFLAFSSAWEIGRKVNVSESTVIRWTQKLGYKGYVEFQHVVQRKLAEDRLGKTKEVSQQTPANQTLLENLLDADIVNIEKLKKSMDEEVLLQAVTKISQAKNVYVTSNFFDYGIAHWFAAWLKMVLGNCELMTRGDAHYYQQVAQLNTDDTVIAFVFPRYTKHVIETLETAKKKNAEIIVITDADGSPAIKYTDVILKVSVNSNLSIDSYAAVHALITSVMRFIYVKEHKKIEEKLAKVEEVYKQQNIFL